LSEIEIRVVSKQADLSAIDQTERKVKQLGGTLQRVGETAAGFLVAQGVQAGARKAIALMQSTVNAAKDLGESTNAVSKVFDESTQKVLEWGQANANSFGLSQRAFNQAITPLGAMLKNTGMSMDDVADNTIKLTERAADMASVFNVEVPEALFAIQAALRGETEPIRRFGVSISEVTIQQEALAMTGKAAAKELTAEEKAAARLKLIFDQTADSAGDFKDTSDGLANSQRIATARIEDAKAKIGTAYLPIMAKAAQITGVLAEQFGALPHVVQMTIAAIVAVGAAAVIAIPRILALKASLDAAAAAGSRAAAGITLAGTALARVAPWLLLLGIQQKSTESMHKMGEQAATTAEAEKVLTDEIAKQEEKIKGVRDAWEELHGTRADADKSMLEARRAIEDLGETFEKNKFKVQGNTTAALENRVAMEDAAREAADAVQDYLDHGGSAEGAAKMMDGFRRQAEKSIGATGTAAKKVHDLAVELFKLPPVKTVNVKVNVTGLAQLERVNREAESRYGGFAHGGITGAAGGGPRGGMTWVGEQGPELVRLPYGSTVYPAGQSAAMAQGGGGSVTVVVEDRTSGGIRARLIDDAVKRGVRSDLVAAAYP
jgi:hypothetical protein